MDSPVSTTVVSAADLETGAATNLGDALRSVPGLNADVLTPAFHGFSSGYRLVDGSFGVRWQGGRVTTLVKVTNLLNESIQQHIFGDILRRTVVGEVRFSL